MDTEQIQHDQADAAGARTAPHADATIAFGGATLTLTGDRAVYWPEQRTLLLADLHLGKPASFRERGAPVPEEVTASDLARLDTLIARFTPERVIVLGDLAHDRAAWQETTLRAFADWRGAHKGVGVVLVRGNHDRWADDPPASLKIEVVEPGWVVGGEEFGLALHHEPPADPTRPALCGHLHPGIHLRHARGRGRAGLRSACYWVSVSSARTHPVLVLPAFGRFTGCAMVRPLAGDRVFAVGEGLVAEVAAGGG